MAGMPWRSGKTWYRITVLVGDYEAVKRFVASCAEHNVRNRWATRAVVTAMLDRLLYHGHSLKCGPRSCRARPQTEPSTPGKP